MKTEETKVAPRTQAPSPAPETQDSKRAVQRHEVGGPPVSSKVPLPAHTDGLGASKADTERIHSWVLERKSAKGSPIALTALKQFQALAAAMKESGNTSWEYDFTAFEGVMFPQSSKLNPVAKVLAPDAPRT